MKKNYLVRSLQVLLTAVGSALLIVGLVVLAFLLKPQWFLNESTLRFGAALLSREGVDVTWTGVNIQAESQSFFIKKLSLDFRGPCIREKKKNAYNGCFDRGKVTVVGGLVHFLPKITEAGPIDFQNGKALVDLDKLSKSEAPVPQTLKQKKNAKPFRFEEAIPQFIREAKLNSVYVDIPKWRVKSSGSLFRGDLTFREDSQIRGRQTEGVQISLRTKGAADVRSGPFVRKQRFNVSLDLSNSQGIRAWNHWHAQGIAHAELADLRTVDINLGVTPHVLSNGSDSVMLDYFIRGNTMKDDELITARLNGSYAPHRLEARINASARNLISEVPHLRADSCKIVIEKKAPEENSNYRVDCKVAGSIPVRTDRLEFLEVPSEAQIIVRADLAASDFIPSDSTLLDGNIDAVMTPILTPLVQARAEVHGRVSGMTGEFFRRGMMDSRVGVEVKFPDFQKLVKKLKQTNWGVPAPFQALGGNVTFQAGGAANLDEGLFPLRLRTRLKSQSQDVNLDAGGTLEVSEFRKDPFTQLNFALTLSDLKVILPRLKLEKPPRVLPDDRIHPLHPVEKAQSEEPSRFGYRIVIKTPPGKPVQVSTNLAKALIPVSLDLVLASDSPVYGKIAIGNFPVEAFRRKGTVQHFDIDLVPEVGESGIDGRLDVPIGDYKTHIQLLGKIDKPQVKITSDPPVGEDQLLAALLFNRAPEELDPDQSAAVGNTRATLSQGALSLASLFLLAATPIESLNYNPGTGEVTAQVRLYEGLSLNLGSGTNRAGTVGLRKRLGSNFFITTGVNNLTQNSSSVSAYLEWRRRY